MATVNEALEENISRTLSDGPRLRYDNGIVILARSKKNRRILLGGLGAMGVGQMWLDEEPHHQNYVGYAEAPEMDALSAQEESDLLKQKIDVLLKTMGEK